MELEKCVRPEKSIVISEELYFFLQIRNFGHLWLHTLHNNHVLLLKGQAPLQVLPKQTGETAAKSDTNILFGTLKNHVLLFTFEDELIYSL